MVEFEDGVMKESVDASSGKTASVVVLLDEWQDYFATDTTIHGCRVICGRNVYLLRRLVWMLVFGMCVICFGIIAFQRLSLYINDPINVNIEINYKEKMEFPAITLCNHNDYRISEATTMGASRFIEELYGSDKLSEEAQRYFVSNGTRLIRAAAHKKEHMIFRCRFSGDECSADNFTEVLTDFGVCYTFNSDTSNVHKTWEERLGAGYGLNLLVNIEQYEYMEGPFNTAGLKILAHAPDSQPRVWDLGFDVPPGMQGLVGIQLTKVTNLPTADEETSCGSRPLTYLRHLDYSSAVCEAECQTDFIREVCGCHMIHIPRLPGGNDTLRDCNPTDQESCVQDALRTFKENPQPTCHCPISCTTKSYVPSLSYAALSGFSAKQILTKEKARIRELERHFRHVTEISSRFRHQAGDLALFGNVSAVEVQMLENGVVADGGELRRRLPQVLAPQCFKNSIGIVAQFEALSVSAVDSLKDIAFQLTDYKRTVFVDGYNAILWEVLMRVEGLWRNRLPPLTKPQDAVLLHARLADLATECRAITDKVEFLYRDFNVTAKSFLDYMDSEASFLQNNSDFAAFASRYRRFFDAETECVPLLADKMAKGFGELDLYIRSSIHDSADNGSLVAVNKSRVEFLLKPILEQRSKCQVIHVENSEFTGQAVERFFANLINNLDNDVNATFTRINRTFDSLNSFNFEAELGGRVFATLKDLEHRYLKQNFTRLQLAKNITSEHFMNQHKLEESLLENVKMYVNNYRSQMLTYLGYLQKLNSHTQPIIKAYLQIRNESYYRYFFEGYLFSEEEIKDCISIVDQRITKKQEEINRLEREIETAITNLEIMARAYLEGAQLDSNFILTNFLEVSVFYRELRLEEITQQVAYNIWGLISDLGGGMGLFMGASFISVFEILDLFFHSSKNRIEPEVKKAVVKSKAISSRRKAGAASVPDVVAAPPVWAYDENTTLPMRYGVTRDRPPEWLY